MAAKRVWEGNEDLRRRLLPIADLRPHPKNPRRGVVPAIQESLRRFGQQRTVLALPDGTLVAGHHVVRAAQEEGWTHVAVDVSDLTDAEVEAYLLADNRLGELGGYDEESLAALLAPLRDGDALAGTGYGREDVTALLARVRARERTGADDVAPEPPAAPKSEPGTVYELGPHRLMCGDSCNPEDVALLLNGADPFLLLTDPPYGVELDGEWRDRAGHNKMGPAEENYMMKRTAGHTNTTMSGDTRADWSEAFELVPSLKIAYVWHATVHTVEVLQGLERIGFVGSQMIIWDKEALVMSRSHYHWQHEPCWYARKPGSPKWIGSKDQTTVWKARSPKMIMAGSKEEKVDHPTQKPVVLYTRPIENHLAVGAVFYEPFGGSGSAIIAAEMTGRACYAMELDPKYVDVIRQRYADYVGDPTLAP